MANYNFPPTSRYYGIELATLVDGNGEAVTYLRRRFVPLASRFALQSEHIVQGGERLDRISAREIGDPTMFWRLCDANNALHPDELTAAIGRRLRIVLPEGIPALVGTP